MNDDDSDAYDRLRKAAPEELLEAACKFYASHNPDAVMWIRLGFKLARDDGWTEVAPAWLKKED